MGETEISLFHIHGQVNRGNNRGIRADYAIQTVWQPLSNSSAASTSIAGKSSAPSKAMQCKIYFMDYCSFWTGTLTQQIWETQRGKRCEDTVTRELYESLTRDAFKGIAKSSDGRWGLSLSVRPSSLSTSDIELTWAGSVTNVVAGRKTQQKTILGTIDLEKVSSEESEEILRQWISATILDRKKYGLLSTELRDYTSQLSTQYEECRKLLADFNLEKKRSQNDLLEKFRALINTKKTKISKLLKNNDALQSQIKDLEKALSEERQRTAVLKGQKLEPDSSDSSPSRAKKEEGDDTSDCGSGGANNQGSSRGRGRGRGRGKGNGRAAADSAGHKDSVAIKKESGTDSGSTKKLDRKSKTTHKQGSEGDDGEDLVPYVPLPHPQDAYGWDEEDSVRKNPNHDFRNSDQVKAPKAGPSEASRTSKGLSIQNTGILKRHLDDLSNEAQKLLERVSKAAANYGGTTIKEEVQLSETIVKQEVSMTSSRSLLRRKRDTSSESAQEHLALEEEGRGENDDHLVKSTKKKRCLEGEGGGASPLGSEIGESHVSKAIPTTTTAESSPEATPRSRSRYPVFAMRKAGAPKAEPPKREHTSSTASHTSLRSEHSGEGPQLLGTDHRRTRISSNPDSPKKTFLTRSDSHRKLKDGGVSPSIISVEELYKELE